MRGNGEEIVNTLTELPPQILFIIILTPKDT